ncbi:MAG: hypothetical protein V1659_02555 [Candidatus Woesearchaeota archaeon]
MTGSDDRERQAEKLIREVSEMGDDMLRAPITGEVTKDDIGRNYHNGAAEALRRAGIPNPTDARKGHDEVADVLRRTRIEAPKTEAERPADRQPDLEVRVLDSPSIGVPTTGGEAVSPSYRDGAGEPQISSPPVAEEAGSAETTDDRVQSFGRIVRGWVEGLVTGEDRIEPKYLPDDFLYDFKRVGGRISRISPQEIARMAREVLSEEPGYTGGRERKRASQVHKALESAIEQFEQEQGLVASSETASGEVQGVGESANQAYTGRNPFRRFSQFRAQRRAAKADVKSLEEATTEGYVAATPTDSSAPAGETPIPPKGTDGANGTTGGSETTEGAGNTPDQSRKWYQKGGFIDRHKTCIGVSAGLVAAGIAAYYLLGEHGNKQIAEATQQSQAALGQMNKAYSQLEQQIDAAQKALTAVSGDLHANSREIQSLTDATSKLTGTLERGSSAWREVQQAVSELRKLQGSGFSYEQFGSGIHNIKDLVNAVLQDNSKITLEEAAKQGLEYVKGQNGHLANVNGNPHLFRLDQGSVDLSVMRKPFEDRIYGLQDIQSNLRAQIEAMNANKTSLDSAKEIVSGYINYAENLINFMKWNGSESLHKFNQEASKIPEHILKYIASAVQHPIQNMKDFDIEGFFNAIKDGLSNHKPSLEAVVANTPADSSAAAKAVVDTVTSAVRDTTSSGDGNIFAKAGHGVADAANGVADYVKDVCAVWKDYWTGDGVTTLSDGRTVDFLDDTENKDFNKYLGSPFCVGAAGVLAGVSVGAYKGIRALKRRFRRTGAEGPEIPTPDNNGPGNGGRDRDETESQIPPAEAPALADTPVSVAESAGAGNPPAPAETPAPKTTEPAAYSRGAPAYKLKLAIVRPSVAYNTAPSIDAIVDDDNSEEQVSSLEVTATTNMVIEAADKLKGIASKPAATGYRDNAYYQALAQTGGISNAYNAYQSSHGKRINSKYAVDLEATYNAVFDSNGVVKQGMTAKEAAKKLTENGMSCSESTVYKRLKVIRGVLGDDSIRFKQGLEQRVAAYAGRTVQQPLAA